MAQIVTEKAISTRCDLIAIQAGGSKENTVLAEGEIWLVDTTNASKIHGYGRYDSYIVGDGTTAAKNLTVNEIDDLTALSNRINTEVSTRADMDDNLLDAIVAEADARQAADNLLRTDLTAEATSRQSADTALQTAIQDEATARTTADALLQQQYNALTQSDIIVGALPASGVPNVIYRVPGTTDFTDYMWYDNQFVPMATYGLPISAEFVVDETLNKTQEEVNEEISCDIEIEKDTAGITKYKIESGKTYKIVNLLRSAITISHRETESGTNHDQITVAGNSTVTYQPTSDGEYIRYGAACHITISKNGTILSRLKKVEDEVEDIPLEILNDADNEPTLNSEKLLKSGGTAVQINKAKARSLTEFYIGGDDLTAGKVITGSIGNTPVVTAINTYYTILDGIPVVPGDIIRLKYGSNSASYCFLLCDANDIVVYAYRGEQYAGKDVRMIIPEGVAKVYISTNDKDAFYFHKNIKVVDELEGNVFEAFTQNLDYTAESGAINASTGADATSASSQRVKIPIPSNAKYIKFQTSIYRSGYGCGFIVGGSWTDSFKTVNKESITLPIPSGATEFRTCYLTSDYPNGIDISFVVFKSEGEEPEPIGNIDDRLLVSYAYSPNNLKAGYVITGNVGSQITETAISGRYTTHGGIQVSEGDIVRLKYTAKSTARVLLLTDSNDIVVYAYKGEQYAGKDVRLVIPAGVSKLYVTTSSVDDFYLVKNIRFYDELETNILNGFLKSADYTAESGAINASTGADAVSSSNERCKIPIPSNAKYISYQSSNNNYGCGFIVNGNWVGWGSNNKESNILIPVPSGATEFRACWLKADYPDGTDIKIAVFAPSEGGGTPQPQDNSMLTTWPVKLALRFGGIGSNGEDIEAKAFTRAQFDCSNMQQITFLKTVGGSSSYSYVFKIGDTWGTPVKFTNNTPTIGTIDVPAGATACKVTWNRNVSSVSDWWINAKGYLDGDTIEEQLSATCNNMAYQFMPDFNLTGINMTDELPLDWDNHQLSTVYDLYDALVTAYPQYVEKIDADSEFITASGETLPEWMNGLHTYMYHFSPTRAKGINHGDDKGSRIRVMLTDIHTNELMGLFSMARMMKHICDNWKTDRNAEQCRSLIDFYVFPITCPWAYTQGSRVNYSGVNINRNFPTHYWESSGSGTQNYSGVTAGDQYETKLMMYFTNLIKPHFLMDCHTTNVNNVGNLGLVLTADGNQQLIDLAGIVARTISNDAIKNNTNFPDNPDYSLYDVYNEPNNSGYFGMYYMWAAQQGYGAAILTEEAAYSNWSDGTLGNVYVEEHTAKLYGLQTRFLFNCVLRYVYAICQQFYGLNDKYYV